MDEHSCLLLRAAALPGAPHPVAVVLAARRHGGLRLLSGQTRADAPPRGLAPLAAAGLDPARRDAALPLSARRLLSLTLLLVSLLLFPRLPVPFVLVAAFSISSPLVVGMTTLVVIVPPSFLTALILIPTLSFISPDLAEPCLAHSARNVQPAKKTIRQPRPKRQRTSKNKPQAHSQKKYDC